MSNKLLGVKQIMKETGLTRWQVIHAIKRKDFPATKIGKAWFVRETAFEQWMEAKFGKEETAAEDTKEEELG